METTVATVAAIIIGLMIGSVTTWLALRQQSTAAETRLQQQTAAAADLRAERDNLRDQRDNAQLSLAAAEANLATASAHNLGNAGALEVARSEASDSGKQAAALRQQLADANRRLEEQGDIHKALTDQFRVLATEIIDSNNEKFLTTADEKVGNLVKQAKSDFDLSKEAVDNLVKPLSQELKRIETARTESQGSLKQQLETLANSNKALELETRQLTTALKRPEVRGSWGEIHLRRVAELAGMTNYCDYEEQVSITSADGNIDRPDMVVRMPSNRTIVVDAKTPMDAYLRSIESNDDGERETQLARHTDQVKARASSLSSKAYWNALDRSPEFVVMFLPGEFLLQPALERDPELFERAMQANVIIATPNTLMALLKTVEMGWKEARLAEHAVQVQKIGQELHDRLAVFAGHIGQVGSALRRSVTSYNSAVGSFDSRVAVSARRFKELGVPTTEDIQELVPLDIDVRQVAARHLSESQLALSEGDSQDDDQQPTNGHSLTGE